jgi:N-acetylgalactosamine kinase
MMNGAGDLKDAFRGVFGGDGEVFVSRAPGRVNIIGEHTDYNGLPVLPMTIAEDIRVAFRARADGLVQMRAAENAFPAAEFKNAPKIPPSPPGAWDNYCKAAIQGLNDYFKVRHPVGMDMFVSGKTPISAGLSSSSALVVACALAYLRAMGKNLETDITRIKLAALLAEAEHYVGTKGGGMDQAIIMLGGPNSACKIDFFPLRVERAPLPENYAIVVCNSLVKAEKSGEALHRYNAGPRLCQLICALVEKRARETFEDDLRLERLGELWSGHLCLTDSEVADIFAAVFPKEKMSLAEAARKLGLSPQAVRDRWLGDLKEPEGGFALKSRARHQLTERQRVEAARDALLAEDGAELGRLMNASHASCAKDYDISCPELNALVDIARSAGAAGARLTGAGFGGCTVNLVPLGKVDSFRAVVERRYYGEYLEKRKHPQHNCAIFVAQAGPAAGYL